jgi:hypothetical protein
MFNENWYDNSQCNSLIELYDSVKELQGDIIEIGCWEGKSTTHLAIKCYPEILICNDTWQGNIAESLCTGIEHPTVSLCKQRDVYSCFINNMNSLTKVSTVAYNLCIKFYTKKN